MIVYFSHRSTEQQVINLTCASASVAEANHFITCENYVFGRFFTNDAIQHFRPKLVNTQDADWYEKATVNAIKWKHSREQVLPP